ncbi:MAG: hypothetical protein ACLGP3_05630 [Acidobacteriota bacterium]
MRKLLPIAVAALLAGCGQIPTLKTGPLASVHQLTVKDVQTALNIAQAQGDTEGAQCWGYLLAQLQAAPGASGALIPPAGIASTFEAGRVAVNMANSGLSAAQRVAFETNCGPMIVNAEGNLTALAAAVGVKIALPVLPTIPVPAG